MYHFYRLFSVLIVTLFLAGFIACQKEMPELNTPGSEPVLPPLTHQGKNTFGCLIDDEPFIAKVDYAFAGPVAVWGSLDEESWWLKVQGTREHENESLDNIAFKAYIEPEGGSYDFFFTTEEFKGYTGYGEGIGCTYYHDLYNKGTVEITFLDTFNNIISGKFEMELINPDCPVKQSISITDGRFDIRY